MVCAARGMRIPVAEVKSRVPQSFALDVNAQSQVIILDLHKISELEALKTLLHRVLEFTIGIGKSLVEASLKDHSHGITERLAHALQNIRIALLSEQAQLLLECIW